MTKMLNFNSVPVMQGLKIKNLSDEQKKGREKKQNSN